MDLGAAALSFLIGTWEGHLTPPEAASIADKASKCRDAAMVRSGAALALSVLPHAGALNPNEIQRAIQQCKEQRDEMLEKACEAVENAAAGIQIQMQRVMAVNVTTFVCRRRRLP